mmetsp:Transcript_3481/g.9344  ORF Transcript_3481/g.9344 Transcript_3481/m.9344 type:complete len:417 (-) Transcript_3481:51-1301(-)
MSRRWLAAIAAAAACQCLAAEAETSRARTSVWPAVVKHEACVKADSLGLLQSAASARRQGAAATRGNEELHGETRTSTAPPADAPYANLPVPGAAVGGRDPSREAARPEADALNRTEGAGGATRAAPAMLLQVNLTAAILAAVQSAPDRLDVAVVVSGMLLLVILYGLTGLCSHLDTPEDEDTAAARFAHSIASKWAVPWRQFRTDHMPALSGAHLQPIADFPLLVPVGSLEGPLCSCAIDILTSSRDKVFTASLDVRTDGKAHLLQLKGRNSHGKDDHVLATVDSNMNIYNAEGHHFARMIKGRKGPYYMEAVGGASCVVTPSSQERMTGVSLTVTSRVKGRLLATAVRGEGKEATFLKVTTGEGVDLVLILIAALGMCAFGLRPPAPEESKEAKAADALENQSLAGNLLESLQF